MERGTEGTQRVGMLCLHGDVYFFGHDGAPANGVKGTGTMAGFAGKGSMCIDYTNGDWYVNEGTLASPTWTKVTA